MFSGGFVFINCDPKPKKIERLLEWIQVALTRLIDPY